MPTLSTVAKSKLRSDALVAQRILELAQQAGIPKGVLNLVTGGGATMGEELVTNKITRLVTMTGSTEIGPVSVLPRLQVAMSTW